VNAMTRCLSVAALLVGAPTLAHHSFSMFDMGKEIELKGSVREFQWTNPHIWVQVLVTGADGKTVEWSIEGNSPSTLSRQGWSKRSLVPGETVTMTVHPLRDGSPGGSVVKILRADGSVVGEPAP
jgi:hypothetical protein